MPILLQTVQHKYHFFKKNNWLKCIQALNVLFHNRLGQDKWFIPNHIAYFYEKSHKLHEFQIGPLNKLLYKGAWNMGTKYFKTNSWSNILPITPLGWFHESANSAHFFILACVSQFRYFPTRLLWSKDETLTHTHRLI